MPQFEYLFRFGKNILLLGKNVMDFKIGFKIKKLRELKNYTQAYMAERLNMGVSGYNKIENDRTEITLSKILSIAEVLETDLETILNLDTKNMYFQHNEGNTLVTGHNTNLTINGNIEQLLKSLMVEIEKQKQYGSK